MTPNLFLPTLLSYLNLFPLLFVWLIGIILAIKFWRRHPVVSMLVVISLVVLLVERFLRIFLSYWLPYQINHMGLTDPQSTLIGKSVHIFEALINAGIWSMLLVALFGWRQDSSPQAEQSRRVDDAMRWQVATRWTGGTKINQVGAITVAPVRTGGDWTNDQNENSREE